jgi:hypothetical protein
MIIISRRLGFLVPLCVILSWLTLALLRDPSGFYTGKYLLSDILFLISSILLPLGLKLNLNLGVGEKSHTFYFIPVQYWSAISLALGLILRFR